MENNKNKKSMKFQGDMLNFCDFIQVFVFTRNHHLKESPIVTERITNSYSNVKQSVSLVQTLNTYESTLIQGHDVESAFLQCCFKLRADRQGTKYQYLYDPQKRHLLDPIGSDA